MRLGRLRTGLLLISDRLRQWSRRQRTQLRRDAAEHDLAASSVLLVAATAVTAVLGYVYWTLAARTVSPNSVGYATALVSAMVLVGEVSSMGLGFGMAYALPGAGHRWSAIVNSALLLVGLAAAALSLIFISGAALLRLRLGEIVHTPLLLTVFVITCTLWAMSLVFDHILVVERTASLLLIRQSLAALARLALAPLALFSAVVDSGFALFAVWGASVLLSCAPAATLFAFHSPLHRHLGPALDISSVWQILPLSAKNYAFAITSMLPYLLLPIIVSNILSFEHNAYYYTSFMITNLFLSMIHATNFTLFSHNAASGDLEPRKFNRILIGMYAFVGPAVLLLIGARELILAMFGPAYVEHGSTLLLWLALLAFPKTLTELYTTERRIRREFRAAFALVAFCSLGTLALTPFLLLSIGLPGVGVAYVSTFAAAAVYCAYDLWHRRCASDRAPAQV